MTVRWQPVALVGCLVLALGAAAGPQGGQKGGGVFGPLEKGQRVALKEKANGYQISRLPTAELSHRILEIGPDYIVLEDISGITQTRIPVFSVRSVTIQKLDP